MVTEVKFRDSNPDFPICTPPLAGFKELRWSLIRPDRVLNWGACIRGGGVGGTLLIPNHEGKPSSSELQRQGPRCK